MPRSNLMQFHAALFEEISPEIFYFVIMKTQSFRGPGTFYSFAFVVCVSNWCSVHWLLIRFYCLLYIFRWPTIYCVDACFVFTVLF